MSKKENKIEISFEYGPKVEVKGNIPKNYVVEFINGFNGKVEYKDSIKKNNKQYMKMEQQLFHEKWKVRFLTRRLREIAPHEALTEEELDEQIKGKQN